MKTIIFLLFFSCGTCFPDSENDESAEQFSIIGGNNATIDEVPYQANVVYFDTEIKCGATIIHEYWVLTAAHCIINSWKDYLTVRTGTDELDADGTRHDVVYFAVHPQYNDKNYDNDIALIKLKAAIVFNKNQTSIPIATPADAPQESQFMLISGFGRVGEDGRQPVSLQKGYVPVIDQEQCVTAYKKEPITSNMFCGGNGIVDACEGDSGGPGTINGKLYGVISTGEYCPSIAYPGVYTRVHLYYDWIVQATGIKFGN